MREVQVTCPQCGQMSGYLEPEASDYTYTGGFIVYTHWICPICGYPDVIWTQWGNRWQSNCNIFFNCTVTNQYGNVKKC